MLFFENHFTKHHFLRAPHKWFLALLVLPIHGAEIYYKKKYHLNFTHARKLFIFDLGLLLSILLLITGTVFWFAYDPTVTDLVYLNIQAPVDKIKSGDYVSYQINYKNESEATLLSPLLTLDLPNGFVLDDVRPLENYAENIFVLPDLQPGEAGSVQIAGHFFGTPDKEERVTAVLSYRQADRQQTEQKSSSLIKILRNSILESQITTNNLILPRFSQPITIQLRNTGEQPLADIRGVLPAGKELRIVQTEVNAGKIIDNNWQIEILGAKESVVLTGQLQTNISDKKSKIALEFTPGLQINGQEIPQTTEKKELIVAHPQVEMSANWQDSLKQIRPAETAVLEIQIKNIGNVDLSAGRLELNAPPAIVDTAKIGTAPVLGAIERGQTLNQKIAVPIKYWPEGGNDIILLFSPRFIAQIAGLANNAFYENTVETPPLSIGAQVAFKGQIRYYTDEGDQLGRGPLPPQVNKETKYWAVLEIANNTSKIVDLELQASLPANIVWTNKSSVSHGQNVKYNPANRQISWTLLSLPAHGLAGVYFELSLTPSSAQINANPVLLQNIQFTATDSYLGKTLFRTLSDLDNSLPTDEKAQESGTKVVE